MAIKRISWIVGLLLLAASAFSQSNLGILEPIGDSLTEGAGSSPGEGGYRHPLDRDLTALGITHQWTGTLATWPGGSWTDGWHDGHGGWSTTDLTYGRDGLGCASQWVAMFHPKTVILMAGRNDPWDWFYGGTGWHDPYTALVSSIFSANPSTTVYWINPFMPRDWNYWEDQRCQVQDAAVRQVITEQRLLGRRIYYVDAYRRLNAVPADYADAVHLKDSGYVKLKNVLLPVIRKTLQAAGSGQQITPINVWPWP